MTRVNVAEAKAKLSQLIDAALQGDDVIISRRNTPLVKLTVLKKPAGRGRFGMFKGRIELSADFDEPLPEFEPYVPRAKRRRKS